MFLSSQAISTRMAITAIVPASMTGYPARPFRTIAAAIWTSGVSVQINPAQRFQFVSFPNAREKNSPVVTSAIRKSDEELTFRPA